MTGKVRIISGQWRRRLLTVPDVEGLRPTPARVRETLFNWLAGSIEGARCLDLYAGSGALGFEAASRGAAQVVLVERDERAVACMREQASALGATQLRIVRADVRSWLQGGASPFDIVFLDPPFDMDLLAKSCGLLQEKGWLAANAIIYLEQSKGRENPVLPAGWVISHEKVAGKVSYSLARTGTPT